MSIDIDALFNKEAFKSIDPERLAIFKQFAREIEGKNIMEVIGVYMKFSQSLPKGKPLTNEEKTAIIQSVGESLPASEQGKFQAVVKILEKL
ncbi:MAG: hypothetical protein FWF44_05875 [Defluviitaleaceae bacterium]|nr:hypothetical protein [Defluviitaleaceae bacterium]